MIRGVRKINQFLLVGAAIGPLKRLPTAGRSPRTGTLCLSSQ